MLKLLILDNLTAFSSDTVYKICLSLEEKGLQEENVERFDSYDSMFEAAAVSLEEGDHVIIAAENIDFTAVKGALIPYFSLQGTQNSSIAEAIAKSSEENDADMEAHSLSPIGAITLLSGDGLYSGFSTLVSGGRLTCLPLDFSRVDSMIEILIDQIITREESLAEMGVEGEIVMPDFDLIPAVTDMVNVLYDNEKTIALSTGEATMWIYNLYDKIDYLTDTIKFADVESNEADSDENESAAVIAKARDAMMSVGADFGGAVSDIYSSYNEEGNIVYYAFAAVVDSQTAGAKKINISDSNSLSIMLPHAVTLLSDMVCKKLRSEKRKAQTETAPEAPQKKEPIVVTPKMIGIIAGLLLAIIIPIVLVFNMVGDDEPTTTIPTLPSTSTTQPTQPTSSDDIFGTTNPNPIIANTEEGATDISATVTAAPQPSSHGVFTFYVFGYGHGVGMSQTGADYLAKQGWTWAEILSHYYYDPNTSIVSGDKYPSTITYSGVEYETRDYLAKALEAEMGSSFHTEALKAQCVAIYTFAKYNKYKLQADAHAYGTSTPSPVIYSVVDDVMDKGFYIANGKDVALTPFHAMSAGKTTSYYNVWGKNSETHVSYLAGGRKSYGDYLDDDFKSVYTITSDDLKKLIESNGDLKVNLSGDPSTWLTILTHDQAVREDVGYVSTINVGGMVLTGNDFRIKVMEGRIRSHCFALQYTPV